MTIAAPNSQINQPSKSPSSQCRNSIYFFGKYVNFILLGGGSFAALIMARSIYLEQIDEAATIAITAAIIISYPHFDHSYLLFMSIFLIKFFQKTNYCTSCSHRWILGACFSNYIFYHFAIPKFQLSNIFSRQYHVPDVRLALCKTRLRNFPGRFSLERKLFQCY